MRILFCKQEATNMKICKNMSFYVFSFSKACSVRSSWCTSVGVEYLFGYHRYMSLSVVSMTVVKVKIWWKKTFSTIPGHKVKSLRKMLSPFQRNGCQNDLQNDRQKRHGAENW